MPTDNVREKARKRLEMVKAWIMQYWITSFQSPSIGEIADQFNTSKQVVFIWLMKLENQQWIEPRVPGRPRNIIPRRIADLLKSLRMELPC